LAIGITLEDVDNDLRLELEGEEDDTDVVMWLDTHHSLSEISGQCMLQLLVFNAICMIKYLQLPPVGYGNSFVAWRANSFKSIVGILLTPFSVPMWHVYILTVAMFFFTKSCLKEI